jgi:hypothetical protein
VAGVSCQQPSDGRDVSGVASSVEGGLRRVVAGCSTAPTNRCRERQPDCRSPPRLCDVNVAT